jgi:hypothetical protein
MGVWVAHYARQVGLDNLFIIDDGSTDSSTDSLGCTVLRLPPLPGRAGFERARMRLVSGIAKGLLVPYDYVVFVDADEFIVPDPAKYDGLPHFLEAQHRPEVVGVTALNMVHLPQVEAPLDLSRPVLEQRTFAKFTPLMCKPSVKRAPAAWAASSHGIRMPYSVDPDLLMFHLKFADRDRLATVSASRHAANQRDGRAGRSTWSRSSPDLIAAFDDVVAGVDPAAIPQFAPTAADVDLVEDHEGVHRTPRQGQLQALEQQPFVRVPPQFRGAF